MMPENIVLEVEVKADGVSINLAPFVQDMLGGAVLGMVSTLRGAENAREIEVKVRPAR